MGQRGLRSNNIEPNARLCMASAVSGFLTQFQSDEPMGCYQDLDAGDDFVLWGNNMAEMHPVLFSRILETRRVKPGTRIVDIATRRTPTSDYADLHVLFKPGTDLALANGILHLLVADGRIHQPFIDENVVFRRGIEDVKQIGYGCFDDQAERYTFEDQGRPSSLDELRTFLEHYTPSHVSDVTGVPVEQIRALANLYGDLSRGTVSLWCMGVNQHVRGTWMNNLITDLHLITGKICRPGANPLSLTGQPSACGTAREVGTSTNRLPADMVVTNAEHRATAERIWKLPAGTIPARPGYHAVDLFRALKRGDVRTLWIQTTNPWVTLPNRSRFDRTPGDGRFIVVSDIYPTPTTAIADWCCRRRRGSSAKASSATPSAGPSSGTRWSIRRARPARTPGRSSRWRSGWGWATCSPGPRTTGASRCSRSTASSASATARTSPATPS